MLWWLIVWGVAWLGVIGFGGYLLLSWLRTLY